jgi:hypothetical protein
MLLNVSNAGRNREIRMRVTRIDIEGRQGRYATICRRRGSPDIEVTVLTPERPEGAAMQVAARSDEAGEKVRRAFAGYLHRMLEGHDGTNSDIEDYYREIERFAD